MGDWSMDPDDAEIHWHVKMLAARIAPVVSLQCDLTYSAT